MVRSLRPAGYPVDVPPTSQRSVSGDAADLADYLSTIQGPIVLAGQSYGGSVITSAATDNPNIKAQVGQELDAELAALLNHLGLPIPTELTR